MIVVVGDRGGAEVVRFVLAHGADPTRSLLEHGWTGRPVAVWRPGPEEMAIRYAVEPAASAPATKVVPAAVVRDDGLTEHEVATAVRFQRVAAYAVVTSHRGVLLTELSSRTNAAGLWNLPGGGIDSGESPQTALLREVFEETGQRVHEVRLLTVLSGHWVGRSPRDRVEDYHAVRVFHTATCAEPTDPVVHDVGGSTSAAAWVRVEHLHRLPLAGSVPEALEAAGLLTP